jgi:hypothetical protein
MAVRIVVEVLKVHPKEGIVQEVEERCQSIDSHSVVVRR